MYTKQTCDWYQYRLLSNEGEAGMEIEDLAGYLPPDVGLTSDGHIHRFEFTSQDQFSFQNGERLQGFFSEFISEFPPPYQIIFNFERVQYLSSIEIGFIAAIARAFAETGNEIVACGLNPAIDELFRLFNLDRFLEIVETEEEAKACFLEG